MINHEEIKKLGEAFASGLSDGKWIPWPDRRPEHSGPYLVSGGGKVWLCEYLAFGNLPRGWLNNINNPCVRAWMPLPEPYREDEQ